ncbi:MAG TPA: glycosyltransferase family 39 protein [Thermoguttaceae bacterium]|nr:glycosyltransferase family 39 protein [Thermoguttaceae bacterium]
MSLASPKTADRRITPAQVLLAVNVAGLCLVALWFRCRSLENIPGTNGDEAWYGVKALRLLWGEEFCLRTPTRNALNPFFYGPIVLLNTVFPPSIRLLRSVALLSGLAALAINWVLCRRVFDRLTAVISTVVLALLPINIAYSRFAWDTSQTLASTLAVLYCSLAAVRFRRHRARWLAAAGIAQIGAVLVHPTNILIGSVLVVAVGLRLRARDLKPSALKRVLSLRTVGVSSLIFAVLLLWAINVTKTRGPSQVGKRFSTLEELVAPKGVPDFAVLYPRLLSGGTVYRYIPGSRSWSEWPNREGADGVGVDVVLFWGLLAAAIAGVLWRGPTGRIRWEDRALVASWGLTVIAFWLLAGPRAMVPGVERNSLCLLAPTVILVSRGLSRCRVVSSKVWGSLLVVASLAGWFVLADFHQHYFRVFEQTGGRSEQTFRTAEVEPKQAALRIILEHRQPGTTWIVVGEWWNYWPIEYFAMVEEDIRVVNPKEAEMAVGFDDALHEGRVWCVEFSDSDRLGQARQMLGRHEVQEWVVKDFGSHPLLSVLHGK